MRDSITIIGLHGHPASKEADDKVRFWFERNTMVSVQKVTVKTNGDMKRAKKEYKFSDLPCLVNDGARYYGEGIDAEIRRLRDKWSHLK